MSTVHGRRQAGNARSADGEEKDGVTVSMREAVVTQAAAVKALALARLLDVECGGIYDAQSAEITVWSIPWNSVEERLASEVRGRISVTWDTPNIGHATIRRLEVEDAARGAELWRYTRFLFGLPATTPAPW
jgi:hypothetical protein